MARKSCGAVAREGSVEARDEEAGGETAGRAGAVGEGWVATAGGRGL